MRTTRKPERIGQLLTVAAAAAQSLARERLRPLGLTPRGWAVLSARAEEGPRPQINLAAATGTDRTVMTYLLDELERQNLNLLARVADGWALREGALARPTRSSQALAGLDTLAGSDSSPKRRTRRPTRSRVV